MPSSSRLDAAHNRVEFGNELRAHMDILTADEFIDELNQYDSSISNFIFEYALEPFPSSDGECCDFLNRLLFQLQRNYYVFETGDCTQCVLRFTAEITIEFITLGFMAPNDHRTTTKCRPDLVAILKSHRRPSPNANKIKGQGDHATSYTSAKTTPTDTDPTTPIPANANAIKPLPVDWVNLEAVVAYHLDGASVEDNIQQAVAYTGYLLAARPDRVAILGLYISQDGFAATLVDPAHVYCTKIITWTHTLAKELLFRVLHYISCPPPSMIDPTTRRDDDGTFQVTVNGSVHKSYRQFWYPTLGRWTTILKEKDPGTGHSSVLKFQYIRTVNDIPEGRILERIHEADEIPGVVRVEWHGWVQRTEEDIVACGTENGRRQKACLKLKDEGDLFMGISNPRDALIVIWDLLEGDTFLHLSFRC